MPQPRRIALQLELEIPFKRHGEIFAGTQRYAAERGWISILDDFLDEALVQMTRRTCPYDGIIARATEKLADQAERLGVPVVNVWYSSAARERLPGMFSDNRAVGRLMADHLLSRGLRQFAFLARSYDKASLLQGEAFQQALAEAGLPCLPAQVAWYSTLKGYKRQMEGVGRWMDRWELPIGVVVGHDSLGRMVAQLCAERGWRVPRDVAIIAGLNQELICEHPRPSLTSVEIGYERIGYEAARLLEGFMDEAEAAGKSRRPMKASAPASPPHIVLPPIGLVVRESTDFTAVSDPVVAEALAFIANHSHRNIGVGQVSRAVATEIKTLQNRFRKVLDSSIAQEIRRVRIERAKRELVQGERSIMEIARHCGFGESKRMGEVFRRELGMSPGEYRKQILGQMQK